MEKAEQPVRTRTVRSWGFGFHHQMAYANAIILTLTLIGFSLTHTYLRHLAGIAIGCVALIAIALPLPLYLYEKKEFYWFESVLTIIWAAVVYGLLHFFVVSAGRFGARFPLYDSMFVYLDRRLGVSVPAIMAWAPHHWIGQLADRSYSLLVPMLVFTMVVPIFLGRLEYTRQFVIANILAFAIGLPLFSLFPAVGPWYGFHFTPTSAQAACQTVVLLMRVSRPYRYQGAAGLICFPSFHVIWAILCARALWGFRYWRIPIAIFTGLMIFSTMTTGWHYFCDVLAGILIAGISTLIAGWLLRLSAPVHESKELGSHAVALT